MYHIFNKNRLTGSQCTVYCSGLKFKRKRCLEFPRTPAKIYVLQFLKWTSFCFSSTDLQNRVRRECCCRERLRKIEIRQHPQGSSMCERTEFQFI